MQQPQWQYNDPPCNERLIQIEAAPNVFEGELDDVKPGLSRGVSAWTLLVTLVIGGGIWYWAIHTALR